MKKRLTLGLFGFGCVGQGLYRVLNETQGLETEIKKICIKHPDKSRTLPSERFTTVKEDILSDSEIDVVVELIDDAEIAFEIVREAVKRGKAVVTANKRMLAERLDEILELQETYGRPILYEGAVCGSIPIIRNLEEYYDNDQINRVEGIVNGSTNYILTKVSEEGWSYAEALCNAQELGFAESDPSLDVKGFDPSFKLSILLTHAFGLRVKSSNIVRIGIDQISASDVWYAQSNHLRIKLVASAYRSGNSVIALVAPRFVKEGHPLYSIRNEFNAVCVEGLFAEEQLFVGKGAGGNPTGSAVLSDISALRYDYRYAYRKLNQSGPLSFTNEALVDASVSFPDSVSITPQDFVEFKGGVRTKDHHRMHGLVRIETLFEWSQRQDISIILSAGAVPQEIALKISEELVLVA